MNATQPTAPSDELLRLINDLCEDQLSDADCDRLEQLVLADPAALALYLDHLEIHGLLHWDAAGGLADENGLLSDAAALLEKTTKRAEAMPLRTVRAAIWVSAVVAGLAVVITGFALYSPQVIVQDDPLPPKKSQNSTQVLPLIVNHDPAPLPDRSTPTIRLPGAIDPPLRTEDGVKTPLAEPVPATLANDTLTDPASRKAFVSQIDRLLASEWRDAGIEPSELADDAEWMRRIHLDLVGHIPDMKTIDQFLADRRPDKRERMVETLFADADHSRYFADWWTTLLVGRTTLQPIDRDGLRKFLREQFHHNAPWKETVTALLAAEGSATENGAANFLLAHLNNEAVPATAVTSRIFLCCQIQCTQCHKHPTNDWTQDQFWELNSFFQQTEVVKHSATAGKGTELTLTDRAIGGPTVFEQRSGTMKAAYPRLNGTEVDPSPETPRRKKLAEILSSGERPQLARALVNRLWGHFYGQAFTSPMDDMGPHSAVSHPELLEAMTGEFVKSGYDVRQLMRWMVSARSYQLTSRFGAKNHVDDPTEGARPLFSRMYLKPLSAEQIFDSVLVATRADRSFDAAAADRRRQEWLRQFFSALDNEENSESTTFDGSLSQAVVMMNGDLVRQGLSLSADTVLANIVQSNDSDAEKLRRLSLAVMGRRPTPKETALAHQLSRLASTPAHDRTAPDAYRDMFWAYLNSSEFLVNH